MSKTNFLMLTLEHIDPQNSKHICGLRNEFNEVLADGSYNFRKSNRFVPFRVCEHSAPVTFGDIGEFLIDGEWLVCEFGGKTWWDESNRIGCGSTDGNDWERGEHHRDAMREVQATHFNNPRCVAGRPKGGHRVAAQRWRCLVTGKTTSPGPLTQWQRARNIDTSLRERID